MNISTFKEIVVHFGDEYQNKTAKLNHVIEKQVKAFKKLFAASIGNRGYNINVNEDMIIEELVAIASSKHDEEVLKKVGHQFHDFILSCTWSLFDCKSG